jgi:hypothetical protein
MNPTTSGVGNRPPKASYGFGYIIIKGKTGGG